MLQGHLYRYGLKQNIKTDGREIRYELLDWIYLAEDRYQCRALVKNYKINRVQ
jgi:hypothetical protein